MYKTDKKGGEIMEEAIGLLEDILNEFSENTEITLQKSRITELLEILKKGAKKDLNWKKIRKRRIF